MSAQQAHIHATNKPCVGTLREVTPVRVMLDTLVMGTSALVSTSDFMSDHIVW